MGLNSNSKCPLRVEHTCIALNNTGEDRTHDLPHQRLELVMQEGQYDFGNRPSHGARNICL